MRQLRKKIDEADKKIIYWLCQRQQLVEKIALLKMQQEKKPVDKKREQQIITRALKQAKGKVSKTTIESLYKKIIFPSSYKIHKNAGTKKTD